MSSLFYYILIICVFLGLDVLTVADEGSEAAFHSRNTTFLIRGGYRPTHPNLTKYLVSVRRAKLSSYFGDSHFCSGVIISPRVILTAAHCFVHAEAVLKPSEVAVVASTPQRLSRANSTQILEVSKVVVHENFTRTGYADDIAILHLKTDIKVDNITAAVAPIAEQPPPFGSECVVIGWGRIFNYGPLVNDALYAKVKLTRCVYHRGNQEHVICTQDIDKGVGSSDSGGPIFCNDTATGITSYSVLLSVTITLEDEFTDVWHYRSWVLANVNRTSARSFPSHKSSFPINLVLFILLFVLVY